MRQVAFENLGFFSERTCKRIKEKLEGQTYMNFHIEWSNMAGNCTLIVSTKSDESEEDIRNLFLARALCEL